MKHYDKNHPRYQDAMERVKEKKEFYSNLISWLVVSAFLFGINILTSTAHMWAFYPFLGWGMGVVFHAFKVFGGPGFDKRWEERKLEEEIQRMEEEEDDTMYLEDYNDELELPRREKQKEPVPRKWNEDDLV